MDQEKIYTESNHTCVLFDLDNTLIGIPNTWSYFDGLIQEVISDVYHLTLPSLEERNKLWRSGKAYVNILHNWGVSDPDDFWMQFDQLDAQYRLDLIQNQQLILYEDVIPTLTRLQEMDRVKIGIVTNTPQFIAQHELEAFHLLPFFDAILGLGDDQKICKPEPDGILLILKSLRCSPQKTIFIGDSKIDILAAKRASILPILIDRERTKKSLNDQEKDRNYIRIHSLVEIFDHLR